MSETHILKIENLSKTFFPNTPNERKALCNINLDIKSGDFVTLIGSNGAGKSTLFNATAGNFLCDNGKITLDGIDITAMPEHKRASFIGRMFQDPMLGSAPSMTIEENMSIACAKSNKDSFFKRAFSPAVTKSDRRFFKETLSYLNLGLEDRLQTKMGLLSGGQRQAVTLLMSALCAPKLLLLDEHTAALDPVTAKKVLDITESIVGKNNITTLMITHNIKSALHLGNRMIMMDAGSVILDIDSQRKKDMTVQDVIKLFADNKENPDYNDRMMLS